MVDTLNLRRRHRADRSAEGIQRSRRSLHQILHAAADPRESAAARQIPGSARWPRAWLSAANSMRCRAQPDPSRAVPGQPGASRQADRQDRLLERSDQGGERPRGQGCVLVLADGLCRQSRRTRRRCRSHRRGLRTWRRAVEHRRRATACSDRRSMESSAVATAIRDAVDDTSIRAIIFRVDSPGGSYVASDTIWSEVQRARDLGKPVIVSMGEVAASGGYFVSAPATKIVAQPGTITGSIGVAGGKVVFAGLWNTLRLHWDGVKAGANADMESPHRLFSNDGWAGWKRASTGSMPTSRRRSPPAATCRSRRSRTWPRARSGPAATRRSAAWSTSSAATASPFAWRGTRRRFRPMQQVRVEEFPPPDNPLEKLFEQAMASGQMRACGSAAAGNPAAHRRLAGAMVAAVIAPFEGSGVTAPQLDLAGAIDRQLRAAIRRSCGRRSGTPCCPRRR